MNADRLRSIATHGCAFDTETALSQPGLQAPPLVVGSWAWSQNGALSGELLRDPGLTGDAALTAARTRFEWLLDRDDVVIVGAMIAYDMLVMATDAALRGIDLMPKIWRAYLNERVFDVLVAERLHAVGRGHLDRDPRTNRPLAEPEPDENGKKGKAGYSLGVVTDLVLGRIDAKVNDYWRKRYALLEGLPVEQWPMEARVYPVDDAVNTLEVALAQVGVIPNVSLHDWRGGRCARCNLQLVAGLSTECRAIGPRLNLHDHAVQVAKEFCLWTGGVWGSRTDRAKTEVLMSAARIGRDQGLPIFMRAGFVREDGSESQAEVMRAVALAYGASGVCTTCLQYRAELGVGRVPSQGKTPNKRGRGCVDCNGTGLDLTTGAVPRTDPSKKFPKGQVQIGAAQLTDSGDDFLIDYGVFQEDDKVLDTYGPWLADGHDRAMTHRPNSILKTARVSYRGKAQTMPRRLGNRLRRALEDMARAGYPYVSGVRDTIVARPQKLIYSVDLKGAEMVCHSESCVKLVGFSKLGEALLAGLDIHSVLAAQMMGVTLAEFDAMLAGQRGPEAKKRAELFRQAAKPGNFGLPGRMGPQKLAQTQRKQGPDTPWPDGPSDLDGRGTMGFKGLRFCLTVGGKRTCGGAGNMIYTWARRRCEPTCKACVDVAVWIKDEWRKTYPEQAVYLDEVVPRLEAQGHVVHHYSGRILGGQDGGTIANGMFQAYLADITARALVRVTHEQHVKQRVVVTEWPSRFAGDWSPLYGSNGSVFAHDEFLGEISEDIAPEGVDRLCEIAVEEFRKGCPVHAAACFANPSLSRAWFKEAKEVRDVNGRLQVWEPDLAKILGVAA